MKSPCEPQVAIAERSFAGIAAGAKMLIPTPMIVKDYVESIPRGETRSVSEMRESLARRYDAEFTCPLTSGIFSRIVSEAALDELREGASEITPFWRLVDPKSPLAKKLSCGPEFVADMRRREQPEAR